MTIADAMKVAQIAVTCCDHAVAKNLNYNIFKSISLPRSAHSEKVKA